MKITFLICGAITASQNSKIKSASSENEVEVVHNLADASDFDLLVYSHGFHEIDVENKKLIDDYSVTKSKKAKKKVSK